MKADGRRFNRFKTYLRGHAFHRDAAVFVMGVLCGRIGLVGNAAPFAAGLIAACSIVKCGTHAAFFGAVVGMTLLHRPMPLSALAACALLYALLIAFERWKRGFDRFDRLILLFFSQLALMPVFYRGSFQMLLRGLIALGISVMAALVMQNALRAVQSMKKRHVLTDGEQLSISALIGVMLLGISDISGFGFSLPVALLLWYAMIACYARGVSGVAGSAALAAVLTISVDYSLPFLGGVAACALAGATLRGLKKLGVICGFLVASLLLNTYVYTDPHTANVINLAVAALGFFLTPQEKLLQLCSYLDADMERERYSRRSLQRIRTMTSKELTHTASVITEMAKLYASEGAQAEQTDEQAQWMAQAAYGVCIDCPLKKVCWRERSLACRTVMQMADAHERGERLYIQKPLDPACRALIQIAAAALHAKNQYLVQRAMKKQLARQYAGIYSQLIGVSEIVEKLALRVQQDRWIDEELEQTLLNGLDRRGIRVVGADASFPDGKLQLQIRVGKETLRIAEAFTEAVTAVMRRGMRLIRAETEGRYCTLVMEETQNLCATMGAATSAVSRCGVSGDSIGERRMEHGRVLYALSDGMGVGEAAKEESDAALSLLFDLYEAGFSREVALESVNRLLMRHSDDMYATLDAVHLDLRTGEAEFMKYGAPPSFIFRGKELHTVRAEALPVGILTEAVPAVARAQLKRGDTVVLFSDGALDALGERTCEAIESAMEHSGDSTDAAQKLLASAKLNRQEDDMTVMVIRIA